MSEHTIEKLQEVLSGHIKNSQRISETKITNLTAPGENYGSVMLKLDLTLKDEKDGTQEELHAVAKMIPENDFAKEIFNIQVTFKNEIAMYNTIVPLLQDFQRENGVSEIIDCFPKYYGSRINLGEQNGTVDEDAVLILENLHLRGYHVADRLVGFDLETTQLILKDLAAFHAIPLALKLKKPEVFDKIRPFLAPFSPPSTPQDNIIHSAFIEVLQDSYKCIPWIPKVKKIFANIHNIKDIPPREPFSTVTHGDMWVNNTMVKFQNGVPVSNKLVDFQVCDYKSPATDLFFFLFTSVQLSVLQDEFDNLIEFYHNHFISHLRKLKCDIAPFSLTKFLEEMKAATTVETFHTILMILLIVFGKKNPSKEFDHNKMTDTEELKAGMHLMAKEKAQYLVQTCGLKGWL